ncbi:hypothetical protein D4R87_00880 [bacterium]|nr:MAG: hypothetical protein D4R87_00880 [bacterium]
MYKLVQTKLQKVILLIGGMIIFCIMINGHYSNRYNVIFSSIGVFVVIEVLLIVLHDYTPKFHLKLLAIFEKYRVSISIVALVILTLITAFIVLGILVPKNYHIFSNRIEQNVPVLNTLNLSTIEKSALPKIKLPALPKIKLPKF